MGTKQSEALDRTPMWTLDELCTVLRTTPATVHTWRKHGRNPRVYKVGRHLLFADADVREWLEGCAADAERDAAGHRTSRPSTGSGW
ncbi:helix-turn-helix domain-containing protein [Promicromonospora panici]|uniref:helix-turn-helix domain-containing protein n=1 Tax=Promicromonospora panici TaxID=2219658 RepID=UPI001F5DC269|nr:helix-turn-helix domain-containing protein [Promicromonospora panici]